MGPAQVGFSQPDPTQVGPTQVSPTQVGPAERNNWAVLCNQSSLGQELQHATFTYPVKSREHRQSSRARMFFPRFPPQTVARVGLYRARVAPSGLGKLVAPRLLYAALLLLV